MNQLKGQQGRQATHTDTGMAAAQEAARDRFPPRIIKLLQDVADRTTTATRAPWQDSEGEPLQDDAEAALAWIARRKNG